MIKYWQLKPYLSVPWSLNGRAVAGNKVLDHLQHYVDALRAIWIDEPPAVLFFDTRLGAVSVAEAAALVTVAIAGLHHTHVRHRRGLGLDFFV